jgi:diguanylate cyclase (GGDEF)-like protein
MSLFERMRKLEEQGIDLIEILGQDECLRSPGDLKAIIEQFSNNGDNLYIELLYFLTHRRFSQAESRALWGAILKHRKRMEVGLGRKVRFRVAALDYLSSRTSLLKSVRLLAKPEMDALLSFVVVDEVSLVYNRRYFNQSLSQEVQRARRYGSALTLLVLDLDNFKTVNDRFGHLEGDSALRQVGRLLRESTRSTDAVCRYGGDEFAILLPETTNSEAFTLAERIRQSVGRIVLRPAAALPGDGAKGGDDGAEFVLSASIGGATFPVDCDEAEELVRKADALCLNAKRQGKNRICMSGEQS